MTRSPLRRLPLCLAGLALVVTACAGGSEDGDDGSDDGVEQNAGAVDDDGQDAADAGGGTDASIDGAEATDSVLHVVATVAPIADLTARVGGERVSVSTLVPAGADAHTYEPRPQDVVALTEADAYVGVGLDLNGGAIALAEENLPAGAPVILLGEAALDAGSLVFDHVHDEDGRAPDGHTHDDGDDETHTRDGDTHTHDDDDADHTHEDEETHTHDGETAAHSHDDAEADHTHGDEGAEGPGPNPHVWTSVRNAGALVEAVAEALSDLDPAGADVYAENAATYQSELTALDEAIDVAVATIPEANRTLVTYHDAWTYFARDYGLDFARAVQPADFAEPSAAEVRQVIDLIREYEVPVVFGSEVFPTPVLETIAAETDATYRADLSDDTLPGRPGDDEHAYLELMRRNARAIVEGLGGDVAGLD